MFDGIQHNGQPQKVENNLTQKIISDDEKDALMKIEDDFMAED